MKILILRFSSIGDIVLTTPVVRCIKKQLNAEVHYYTKKTFKDILAHNPYIDCIHVLEEEMPGQLDRLKQENFDCIIDLHHNLRTLRIKKALKVKSFSFNKLNFKKWLLVNFKQNYLPPVHIVDRYLATTQALGVRNDEQGLDYFIPEKEQVKLSSLPGSHQQGYIAFAIGAQHATKRLPAEQILKICSGITHPIILLGGKDDAETAEYICSQLGNRILNACGKYTINQSASLVKQAVKVISHDTGLMHIAAAFDKEIISIWGNTIPEFGMYPYRVKENHIFEVSGLSCRPCSKIGFENCPKGHFNCMLQQDFHAIIKRANTP